MTLVERGRLIPWRHWILLAVCVAVALTFAQFQSMSPPAPGKPVPRTPALTPEQALYRPELTLTRQGSCIEGGSGVADVVVWGGGAHNACVVDPW
jgi:hypothetical protein